ncbi:SIR2 family protein [Agromyces fucosus]|uniref:SIR2 family protein n=1 Tax=Agromyces fucosus TaxID=41985 RepID=A0A4Q2JRG2_9MICO|nr:SIR2 family protein [Agromyces fucosus]RXZ48648.1 SIR2 family protein [Agromyces fucosus]
MCPADPTAVAADLTILSDAQLLQESSPHDYINSIAALERAVFDDSRPFAFLLGAGCSTSVPGIAGPLVPDIAGLTKQVAGQLNQTHPKLLVLNDMLIADGVVQPTLEDWLTRLRILASISGGESIRGINSSEIDALEVALVEHISKAVNVDLPEDGGGYDAVSRWAGSFDRKYPLEVFSLNYDLLVEQSFERHRVAYFDGFLGSHEPFLDIRAMEDDVLPTRWARLWKMHGSVNWANIDGRVVRRSGHVIGSGAGSLIHPSHLKYDQSRRMPYLAMQDRLRTFLRRTGALLVVAGYSFADEHINEILIESLSGNASAVSFGLLYGPLGNYPHAVKIAKRTPNLRLMAADEAVIGGAQGAWQAVDEVFRLPPEQLGDFSSMRKLLRLGREDEDHA